MTGVRAHLAAQRPDEAERWAERIASALGDWGGPADVAQQHAAGLLSLAAGSSVAARGAFESAVDGWEAIGRIWESTWARLDLVAALVRANRHVDAAPVLREARAVAERLGSAPLLRRADELGSIVRSRGTMDEPWRPLTVREFEVARLVAEGMTNARDRRGARAVAQDRQRPPRAHPREARCDAPGRGRGLGDDHPPADGGRRRR